MAGKYPKLWEPIQVGKVTVKNRIVHPPTTTNFASATGEVTDLMLDHYHNIARGGAGMIIVENTQVKYPQGKNVARQLRLDNNKYIAGYRELAEVAHMYGCKIFQQVHHAGRQGNPELSEGEELISASDSTCKVMQTPSRAATKEEIEDLIERYSETALRVKKAGMDGVEFHASHGYLIYQFLSPYTNKRTDEYGGSLENRMRFLLEIIKRAREKLGPDFPICVRWSSEELIPGGLTLEESKEIAQALEAARVNLLNVSCAIYENMQYQLDVQRLPEGWRVYQAEAIKKVVDIPVICVGNIRTPSFAEKIVADGRADFVAISRGLWADPDWPKKAYEGREDEINRCISCNIGCIGGHVFADLHGRCTVNPFLGKRETYTEISPAPNPKKVLVIGGGPAGMWAAYVAKKRGHEVTLWERSGLLGGTLHLAAATPDKGKYLWVKEDCERRLKRANVTVKLNKEATLASIKAFGPETVIVATGASPIQPDIPGREKAVQGVDALSGKVRDVGNNPIVVGAGLTGMDLVVMLGEQGKHVTLVTRRSGQYDLGDGPGVDMEPIHRYDLFMTRIPEYDLRIVSFSTYKQVTDSGLIVVDKAGKENLVEGGKVIFALGFSPNDQLVEALQNVVPQILTAGDTVEPRKVLYAVAEGLQAGRLC
jgi:2,4-dienoyl-CoA reductase-like NADH-dependent reductase (Old Yellow Enzyme family)/thioredoxin reductase